MLLFGRRVSRFAFLGLDYLVILVALRLSAWLRNHFFVPMDWANGVFNWSEPYLYFVIPGVYIAFMISERLYDPHRFLWKRIQSLVRACVYATFVMAALNFFISGDRAFPRSLLILSAFFAFILLFCVRHITKRLLVLCGLWQAPVLVVGAGKTAELLDQVFIQDPNMGYRIIGFLEDSPDERPLTKKYPVLGRFEDAGNVIRNCRVDTVILATPGLPSQQMIDLFYRIQHEARYISIIPDLFGLPVGNLQVETFFDQKMVLLQTRNNMASRTNRLYKWLVDIAGALFGVIFLLPVTLLLAVVIYLDSPGPILFSHRRVGQNGREFPCYKFRTMVPNSHAELQKYLKLHPEALSEWETYYKLKDDPRITRVGRWLRKYSLDELPQFLNVLKGEMSLVGPRPIVQEEVAKYGRFIEDFFLVKPGITGLWQVSGRNDISYDDRVHIDSWYVRNWSVWLDLVILLKTVRYVISGRGGLLTVKPIFYFFMMILFLAGFFCFTLNIMAMIIILCAAKLRRADWA